MMQPNIQTLTEVGQSPYVDEKLNKSPEIDGLKKAYCQVMVSQAQEFPFNTNAVGRFCSNRASPNRSGR
jgi:hypothetical protein